MHAVRQLIAIGGVLLGLGGTSEAWALQCEEVANMELAGVPTEAVVRLLDGSGPQVDLPFIQCLAEEGVSLELIRAAWRLRSEGSQYQTPLVHVQDELQAGAMLELDVMCGAVTVVGTDASRVRIEGKGPENATLDAKFSRSALSAPIDGLQVAVRDLRAGLTGDPAALPQFTREGATRPALPPPCADLTIEMPRQAGLKITSARADLRVWFVDGPLQLNTHFGDIEIVGHTDELMLRTTSGNVVADTASKHIDIETVSGMIEVSAGNDARATLTTISGPIWVWGGPIRRLDASTVSGDIRMNASMTDAGTADLETHRGHIEARVPDGDIVARSHEGAANGPAEMVRPDGFSQRQGRSLADGGRFAHLDLLNPDLYGVWAKTVPERWWFRRGAVISSTLDAAVRRMQLSARSFSGDVTVTTGTRFPAPTGPLIAGLEAVGDRVDVCVQEQRERHPGAEGHAVLTLSVGKAGAVEKVTAPMKADDAEAIADGRFAACLVRAVEKRTFDAPVGTTVRWPVPFRPDDAPAVVESQRALSSWLEGSGSLRPDRRAPPSEVDAAGGPPVP